MERQWPAIVPLGYATYSCAPWAPDHDAAIWFCGYGDIDWPSMCERLWF
jgi:hypothetical protein